MSHHRDANGSSGIVPMSVQKVSATAGVAVRTNVQIAKDNAWTVKGTAIAAS